MPAALRPLYETTPAWRSEWLEVDGGHSLHVQQFGAPDGLPVLVLHGGPGSGCSPLLPRFCDPRRYRIVCPDQRGAGQSRPSGEVAHNTTAFLLADLRTLRAHLQIARWLVVGGSWGATLALAHAADAPEAVAGLLLRSSFLARAQDIAAFFDGAAHGRPQAWPRTTPWLRRRACRCRGICTAGSAAPTPPSAPPRRRSGGAGSSD